MAIYLDYNATTPVDPCVLEAMNQASLEAWANPSSVHRLAQKSREYLEGARNKLADLLGLDKASQIVWTSGGTESNVTALMNCFRQARHHSNGIRKNKLVISSGEHSSVLKTARAMAEEWGVELVEIPLTLQGIPDLNKLAQALDGSVFLVSMMAANNETGAIYPIQEIGKLCRERGVLFHTDAVNALGKADVSLNEWPADFISLGGHKIHGPKGVGALIVRTPHLLPLFYGGGQERNRRSGTENVPGAVGLVKAIELFCEKKTEILEHVKRLRNLFEELVLKAVPHSFVVAHESPRTVNTSCVCFEGISAQSLLINLDLEDVCVSSGSACASGSIEPSHVILAMGHSRDEALSTIRVSLSRTTTEEEIRSAAEIITKTVERLRAQKSNEWRARDTSTT